MCNVLIIDESLLSAAYLAGLLENISGVALVGHTSNVEEVIDIIKEEKVDIIFVNIDNKIEERIEVTKEITSNYMNVKVVFMSTKQEYAVKAFKLGVYDYILKPIDPERLNTLLRRWNRDSQEVIEEKNEANNFYQEIEKIRWRTQKSKELFLYLYNNKSKPINKTELAKIIWPDTPIKKSYVYLYNSIYSIRNVLRDVIPEINIYSVNENYVLEIIDEKSDLTML